MHSLRISSIALLAALIIATPVSAVSLKVNAGGNGGSVNVNTSGSQGNTGDAHVNAGNTNIDGSADLDDLTNGDDGDNTPVDLTIGNGGKAANVKVTGSPLNSSTTKATVTTGTLLPGATGGLVDDGTTNGSVTLGGSGSNAVDGLFGGTTSGKVNLSVGKTVPLGTSTPLVGNTGAAPSTANVAINTQPSSLTNSGVDPMGSLNLGNVASGAADINALQSLFGGTVTLGGGDGTSGTGGNATDSTSGDDGTGTSGGFARRFTSVAGGDGSSSEDGDEASAVGTTNGSGTDINGGVTTGATQVASLDGSVGGPCFAPSASQRQTLLTRHPYNDNDLAYFGTAKSLQVVSVGLCGTARTEVSQAASASAGVSGLQSFIARSASLSGALAQQNHKPSDVVAVDRKGDTLIVYVI